MTDKIIYKLAERFREAIVCARNDHMFKGDTFEHFLQGCCGDASCLFAEYLLTKCQESIYVWGEDETGQTHAWLVIKDDRISIPAPDYYSFPDELKSILIGYGNRSCNEPIDRSHYTEADLFSGVIVDITADQFGEASVYVGELYSFYQRFEFKSANDYTGLGSARLRRIYKAILNYL